MKKQYPKIITGNLAGIWKTTKLKKIAEIIGGGTPDTKQLSYWNGGINWFSPTEVGKTVYLTKSEKTISQLGLQKSSAKLLPAFKTILFTSRAGIGDVGILTEESATNQGFQSLVVNEETDVYFLYSYSDQIKKYALKHSAGSTFLEISGKELGKMELSIPSLPEQQAIGSLFHTLDNLLTSYKDNLANYQSLKATMLSKMFPKAGQTVPEIRLDGFEGEWKVVNLGTLIENYDEVISGTSGFPIATSSRKGLYLQNDYFEGGRTGIDLTLDFHRVPIGYVTYRHMSDDSIFKFNKNNFETDVLVSKEYPVFISNDSSDIDFLLYHLNNSRLFLRFSTMQKLGGTRVRLYYKNLITYKIAVPTVKEQQAIGTYFSNLDNLINSHQEKISQLETLKKKLLQDMFI